MGGWLRDKLALPGAGGCDLDARETTDARMAIIRGKPYLRKLYTEWYHLLIEHTREAPSGPRVEVGSGAGFFKEILPGLVTTEVQRAGAIDAVADAAALPFRAGSLGAVYGVDVLHHFQEPSRFLTGCARVLVPGGYVALIEPWNTPWGRFVWTHFHHEPFDPKAGWQLPGRAPLSEANGALPWILFHRDRKEFEARHPALEIVQIQPFLPLAYVLSGGVSMRAFLPGWAYGPWRSGERMLGPFNRWLGMFALIVLRRRSGDSS